MKKENLRERKVWRKILQCLKGEKNGRLLTNNKGR